MKRKRHSWHKVREHSYLCRTCGTGKLSEQDPKNRLWRTVWFLPNTQSRAESPTPPCQPEPFTKERLARHGL